MYSQPYRLCSICRCVDYVYYYPKQPLPSSGNCGYRYCDGSKTDYSALDGDSDFNRTFGKSMPCDEEGKRSKGKSRRKSKR